MAISNRPDHVAGAILVAPADPQRCGLFGAREGHIASYPSIAELLPDGPLNILGLLIASRNDPWMKFGHAYACSKRWELAFHDAGEVGHINVDSGFGPWPLIKLFTDSLYDLLQENLGKLANADRARTVVEHKVNPFLPHPTITFNQQHLLYA